MSLKYIAVPYIADDASFHITYQPFVEAHCRPSNPSKAPEIVQISSIGYINMEEMIQTFESRLHFGGSKQPSLPATARNTGDVQDTIEFIVNRLLSLGRVLLGHLTGPLEDQCIYDTASQNCKVHEKVDTGKTLHEHAVVKDVMRDYLREHAPGQTSNALALQQVDCWVTGLLQRYLQTPLGQKYTSIVRKQDILNTTPSTSRDLGVQYVQTVLGACSSYSMDAQASRNEASELISMHAVLTADLPPVISDSIVASMSSLVGVVAHSILWRGKECEIVD